MELRPIKRPFGWLASNGFFSTVSLFLLLSQTVKISLNEVSKNRSLTKKSYLAYRIENLLHNFAFRTSLKLLNTIESVENTFINNYRNY